MFLLPNWPKKWKFETFETYFDFEMKINKNTVNNQTSIRYECMSNKYGSMPNELYVRMNI